MSIEQAVFLYAVLFCIFLIPLIWLLIKRRAEKKAEKIMMSENAESTDSQTASKPPINWGALLAMRPHAMLTGEMWLKTFIAAFIALSVGVIIVIFVFPLGAGWAASAAFVAVIVIVGFMFSLLD